MAEYVKSGSNTFLIPLVGIKHHWRGFNTRNAHMVHIVNQIRFLIGLSISVEVSIVFVIHVHKVVLKKACSQSKKLWALDKNLLFTKNLLQIISIKKSKNVLLFLSSVLYTSNSWAQMWNVLNQEKVYLIPGQSWDMFSTFYTQCVWLTPCFCLNSLQIYCHTDALIWIVSPRFRETLISYKI